MRARRDLHGVCDEIGCGTLLRVSKFPYENAVQDVTRHRDVREREFAFMDLPSSSRPAERVVNEVSIMIGYALKPGSESTLEVGGAAYSMYTQGDGLWIKNAAEEDQMVQAMRRSADATVKGVSAKGTETVDTFSMKGLSHALDRIAQDCRR